MRVHVCYLSKPLGVPCISASMLAHREHHTHIFMLSRKKIQPHFPFARQSKSEEFVLACRFLFSVSRELLVLRWTNAQNN